MKGEKLGFKIYIPNFSTAYLYNLTFPIVQNAFVILPFAFLNMHLDRPAHGAYAPSVEDGLWKGEDSILVALGVERESPC